jgi:predicted DsbA family dithiol-disulfide isomerase
MKKFPQAEFKVNWRPFELNPSAPKEGTNKVSIRLHGERVSKKEVG